MIDDTLESTEAILSKNKRKKTVIKLTTIVIILLLGFLVFLSPLFKVNKIEYNLNANVNEKDIYKAMDF